MNKILRHLDKHLEIYLASILLIFFSLITFTLVLTRYVFKTSVFADTELAKYSFIWFVFISASYAVRERSHVKLDFVKNSLPEKFQNIVEITSLILWFIFLLILDVLSFMLVKSRYLSGQVSPEGNFPMYILYLGLPIGVTLMAFRLLQHIINFFKNSKQEGGTV